MYKVVAEHVLKVDDMGTRETRPHFTTHYTVLLHCTRGTLQKNPTQCKEKGSAKKSSKHLTHNLPILGRIHYVRVCAPKIYRAGFFVIDLHSASNHACLGNYGMYRSTVCTVY